MLVKGGPGSLLALHFQAMGYVECWLVIDVSDMIDRYNEKYYYAVPLYVWLRTMKIN